MQCVRISGYVKQNIVTCIPLPRYTIVNVNMSRTYIRLNIHVRTLAHPAAVTSYEGSFATVGDLHDVPCYWVRFIPILFKYAIHKEHFSTLVQQAGFESYI